MKKSIFMIICFAAVIIMLIFQIHIAIIKDVDKSNYDGERNIKVLNLTPEQGNEIVDKLERLGYIR